MKYIECRIFPGSIEGLESLISLLCDMDVSGMEIEDPREILSLMEKKNSYDWDYLDESVTERLKSPPSVTFYTEESAEGRSRLDAVIKAVSEVLGDELTTELRSVDDGDWKDKWKEYFKPVKLSDRLVIKPTWEEYEKQEGEEVIELDPGMAFGTGTHETTRLCVRLMEKYIRPGDRVLDVGSGSGILTIAACLLGAGEVLGIDIDPEAVKSGRENVEINGLSGKARIEQGDLTKGIDFRSNLLLANLMADLVKILSKDAGKHLLPGGIYISSGILTELAESVTLAITQAGFEILEIAEEGEWCAVAARRR